MSPDGKSVYVASQDSNAVAIFDRDPMTGKLTQKPGTDGCISETGSGGACTDGTALAYARSVTISPDGKNAYVASLAITNAVAIFDRDPTTGKLTQKPGTDGCISETGSGGACTDGRALIGADSITLSPTGRTSMWPLVSATPSRSSTATPRPAS
ncbi:MAG: beta-propeller fold lactonase family protein [Solirubrobacterales bacterium]